MYVLQPDQPHISGQTLSQVDKSSTTTIPSENISHRKTTKTANHDRFGLISRSELIGRIAQGENLVIYRSQVLDLTRWADKHPGGKLAVLHFVGRDASDEMDAYHSAEDIKKFQRFVVGKVSDDQPFQPITPPIALGLIRDQASPTGWRREGQILLALEVSDAQALSAEHPTLTAHMLETLPKDNNSSAPTIDLGKEKIRSDGYRQLKERIEKAGLFKADSWHKGYLKDIIRSTALASMAALLYFKTPSVCGQMLSAVCLGAFWHQMTFVVHDAGHTGITGDAVKDRAIGSFFASWVGGLSVSWWKDNHNIHHLVTNHPEHDPDIQHIPFFAISPKFFGNMWSTYYKRVMAFDAFSKMMVQVQHKVYYVVLSLARFNLYALSYGYLATKMPRNRWFAFEAVGLVFFWTWFGSLLRGLDGWKMRVAYLLVSHIVTSPVHVQIVLSHFARSTEDLGPSESFVSRQLRTTMDVVCDEWIEFFHGGLHLQVTHHLFPRIPRHNLRRASKLVKDYCKEQDMEYAEYSFTEGNRRVLRVLRDVANQVTLLGKVAAADARGELH